MASLNNYAYYDNYESAKLNLQRQTAALLAERNQLQSRFALNEPVRPKNRLNFTQSASLTPVALDKKIDNAKTQEVVNKLQQIIRLCKEQGSLSNQELREVIKVQSEVLNYLQQSNELHPKLVNPRFEQNVIQGERHEESRDFYQYKNKQPTQQQTDPQFRLAQEQLRVTQGNYSSDSKIDAAEFIKPTQDNTHNHNLVPQIWGKDQGQQLMSEDAIQIIAEIQRKALGEIIHLQQERDSAKKERDMALAELQKFKAQFASNQHANTKTQQEHLKASRNRHMEGERLFQENKALRAASYQNEHLRHENKLLRDENRSLAQRIEFIQAENTQAARKTYAGEIPAAQHESRTNLAHGQYDSQIVVYQNQLRKASLVITELRSRLANVPGLQELHQQGERIRRDTAELLQVKAAWRHAPSGDSALVRQLQERLEEEEKGKALFLQELKSFKQRFSQLEEENRALKKSKGSFEPVHKPMHQTHHKESSPSRDIIKNKNSYFGEYQQTLNQMKRVLY